MKKIIVYDTLALRELQEFDQGVREDFVGYIDVLEAEGKLEYPEARKIARNLFEIRVKHQGEHRVFYAYVRENSIVILHFFQKKTQKTPLRNIETAYKRLKQYE